MLKQHIKYGIKDISTDVIDLYARMEAEESTPDDLKLLLSWAVKEPEKLEQFESMSNMWDSLGGVNNKKDRKSLEEKNIDDRLLPKIEKSDQLSGKHILSGFHRQIASIAAVFIMVFGFFYSSSTQPLTYQTKVGELIQVALVDGSKIHMNGNSSVNVDYNREQRNLTMGKGEAFFEVAHEENRSFNVEVGGLIVTATGTEFNIDYTGSNVTVTVVEGTIEVREKNKIGRQGQKVIAAKVGDQIKFQNPNSILNKSKNGDKKGIILLEGENLKSPLLGWREGFLNLTGEPLITVIEKMNRQSLRQITLSDTALNSLPIYGTFHLNNVESFVAAIEALYPIEHKKTLNGFSLNSRKK